MARGRMRHLGKRGGSLGLTLPSVIVKALGLRVGDPIEVRLRNSVIEIARVEQRP